MATITLKFDANNALAQKTLNYILSLGVFEVKKTGIQESLEDIKKGKVTTYNSVDDFFKKL